MEVADDMISEKMNLSSETGIHPGMLEGPNQPIEFAHKIVTSVITSLVIIVSIIGLVTTRHVRTFPANKRLVTSAYISDILFAAIPMALSVLSAWLGEWGINPYIWLTQVALSSTLWVISIYSVAFINIDHYIAVTEPAHYQQQLGPMKTSCWIVFIWTLGLSYCVPFYLFGPETVIICSSELMFCLLNHDRLATYSATAIAILLPPPILMLIVTSRRGIFPHSDDATRASKSRIIMFRANTVAAIGTIFLWGVGLGGTFSYGAPALFRLAMFWTGLCSPLWRFLANFVIGRSVLSICCNKKARLL